MEQEYTIAEDYELPSGAAIYGPNKFDPHVKLRSWTVREEMKRQGNSQRAHEKLCNLIDACLLTKLPMSVYDMHVGDYEYLLHKLRVVTYGPEYKISVTCPHCFQTRQAIMNLDDLKVKKFDLKDFDNCLNFKLPKSGDEIVIRYQTPRMLDDIDMKIKEFRKKNPEADYDPTTLITLQEVIETVNGNKLKYVELETYLNNLNARDANYILNRVIKSSKMIGLDTIANVSCASCGGDIITYFQFGPEFFRPVDD